MNGVDLKTSIKLFGFKDGFSFWFKWSFSDPIKEWWWLNITHKPYCIEHGFFLPCSEECTAKKLHTKKEILAQFQKNIEEGRAEGFF